MTLSENTCMPSLGVNPFEFLDQPYIAKTISRLSVGEGFVILACAVLTQFQRVIDERTDGRTDMPTIATTGLCIASYADALQKSSRTCYVKRLM